MNYRVYTASSPVKGLEELDVHQDEIIIVISDMKMPKMNGVQFIKKAREKHRNVVYFILSGFDYNEEIDSAIQSKEVEKFFTKPFVKEDIDLAIDLAIKRASYS